MCGRSACTVRREGGSKPIGPPYPYQKRPSSAEQRRGPRMSHAQTGEGTWIDELADRFEHEWKHGASRPRIEDFLAGQSDAARHHLLTELLRLEREFRENAGEKPNAAGVSRSASPDEQAAVAAAFGLTDRPRSGPSPPRSAARSLLFGLLALQNNFIDRDDTAGRIQCLGRRQVTVSGPDPPRPRRPQPGAARRARRPRPGAPPAARPRPRTQPRRAQGRPRGPQ